MLSPGAPGHFAPLDTFRQGLRDLGYVERRNTIIYERFAEDRTDQLIVLARDLVQGRVDVIFAINTPAALAAKNATTTIPIVVTRVSDPIGAGLVASLAQPGGNITGLTTVSPELSGKRLELVREALPGVQKVTILWNPANIGHSANVREMEAAGPQLHLDVSAVAVRREDDVSTAIQTAVKGGSPALAVVSNSALGTTAVSYSGTVHGQPENVFLSGLVQITRTVVRDPDFGTPPKVLYQIDFSNVTGKGMTTGKRYVTAGNQVLIRPLITKDVVDVIFVFYPSGGTFLAARPALASFTFNYDTRTGTATGTTTSASVDVTL